MSAEPYAPALVAHRGVSRHAPENTLAAFRLAWEQEADAIECDVRLSRDGEVVCIHDADTKRVTGTKLTIKDSLWRDLKKLSAGNWKSFRFSKERVPLLSEALATVPKGKRAFVELKIGPEIVAPFLKAIEASGLPLESVTAIAFDEATVAECKRACPDLDAYWLTHFTSVEADRYEPDIPTILATLKRCGANGLGAENHPAVDQTLVDALKSEGYRLNIWTVDDRAQARRYNELGVDSITSNDPLSLRKAVFAGP